MERAEGKEGDLFKVIKLSPLDVYHRAEEKEGDLFKVIKLSPLDVNHYRVFSELKGRQEMYLR